MENAQYSRLESLEIISKPASIENDELERRVCQTFVKLGVSIGDIGIQASYRFNPLIIQDYNDVFKHLDPIVLDLPEVTAVLVNDSLCPLYHGLSNSCGKLKGPN